MSAWRTGGSSHTSGTRTQDCRLLVREACPSPTRLEAGGGRMPGRQPCSVTPCCRAGSPPQSWSYPGSEGSEADPKHSGGAEGAGQGRHNVHGRKPTGGPCWGRRCEPEIPHRTRGRWRGDELVNIPAGPLRPPALDRGQGSTNPAGRRGDPVTRSAWCPGRAGKSLLVCGDYC